MKRRSRVLVIGAGIGGLTASIALTQRDAEVEIVEKNTNNVVYGVGLCQPGNALRALKSVGLMDACYAEGLGADCTKWLKADGSIVATTAAYRIADPSRPAYNNIGRPALQRILLSELSRLGVEPRLGVTADKIQTVGDRVEVGFSDGQQCLYDIVIAVDGIRSQTRRMLFGERFEPIYTGHGVWRIPMPRPPQVDCNMIFFGNGKKAGLIPLTGGTMYFWVVVNQPVKERMSRGHFVELARRAFSGFGGVVSEVASSIDDPERIVYSPIEEVIMPRPWSSGRVVLMGDAAHASGPHLGQGAAMAIEDAVVAAELFSSASDLPRAISEFEERRYPRAKFIQDETRIMGNRGQMSGRLKCFVRDRIVLPLALPRGAEAIEKMIASAP